MRKRTGAFTLIELLVVMAIILVLAGLLLAGITAARKFVRRAQTQAMIDNMGMALEAYKTEFGSYPPGGIDSADDGNLDNRPGDDLGCGKDYSGDDVTQLQLRTICTTLKVRDNKGVVVRTLSPYYNPNKVNVKNGQIVDIFGFPLRYLADGRRFTIDPGTGEPFNGRVWERKYTIWSVAEDGVQDALNNNLDDDGNGKVDDKGELENDIGSWF